MESIFVQISSYHDYELGPTILHALEMSSKKYQINFGVHHIYHELDDVPIPKLPNVQVARSKAPENLGMGLGRYIAHQFYNGETYYLQIDAHMRFDCGWDEVLVEEVKRYQALGYKKPVITMYPKNYWYTEDGGIGVDFSSGPSYISFHENKELFKRERITSQTALACSIEERQFTRSVSGGSIFTVGEFIAPNVDIFANGEELFIAARAYTNGFDLLIPRLNMLYHLYYDHSKGAGNRRRLAWVDYQQQCSDLDAKSRRTIYAMFTENIVGDQYLGTVRTLEDFGKHVGLDFTTGEVLDVP